MKTFKPLVLIVLALLLLVPAAAMAQEATDRPFPATAAPTDRPFPATAAPTSAPVEAVASTEPAATEVPADIAVPELSTADLQATSEAAQAQVTQLEAERTTLRAELDAAQADNGATTFALAIVLVGFVLAAAVFFGLRRGSN